MIAFDQTGAAVVGAVLKSRAFAIAPGPASARDAAIAHLTHGAQIAAKGKPHA